MHVMNDFKQEYFIGYYKNPEALCADLAVKEYDFLCEEFDRMVCHGTTPVGIAIPVNAHERALINQNAKAVRLKMFEKYGVSAKAFHEALKRIK